MHGAFLFIAQELFELFICLFWCASFHNSRAVHHAMDMCIDADKWHIVEMREDDLGRLYTDSGKCADGFEGVRDFSSVFVHELFCCHVEVFRFHAIIVHASEHHLDFLGFELQEIGRSLHEFEESFRCFIDSFIRHLSREHDSHEELKWCLKIELYEFRRIELEYFCQDFVALGFRSDFHEIHGREVGWKCKVSLSARFLYKIIAKHRSACYNKNNEEKNTASFLSGEANSVYSGGGIFFIALPHFALLWSSISRVSLRCPL